MTTKGEVFLSVLTVIITILTGSFLIDLVAGIFVYLASRIFHHYYHKQIISLIDKIKKKIKRLKN